MCKAKEISQKFVELMDEIGTEFESLSKSQSTIDKKEQDVLHYIESSKFSASEGYALAKAIKDIRQERRENKINMETIKQLKEKVYKYKGAMIEANMSVVKLEQKERYKQANGVYHNRVLDRVI